MTTKERIEQRLNDLRGSVESDRVSRGAYIETTAAKMVLEDLSLAADIAGAVSSHPPTIAELLALNQLYQAYVAPAFQQLVSRGEISPPPVPTNDAGIYKTKEQLD